MRTLTCAETDIAVDKDGFMIRFEDWTETAAHVLAEREGIPVLSKDRMDILLFLRAYYGKHHFFPILRSVCTRVGQPRNCMTEKFMDPVTAWKIAGLPNPGEEVLTFRSWDPLGY